MSATMEMTIEAHPQDALRRSLINALNAEECLPIARCPRCAHELTAREISRNFSADPRKTEMCCPQPTCQIRFHAVLRRHLDNAVRVETQFYGPRQTVAKLTPELAQLAPSELRANNQSLYYSALYHFKTLNRAFRRAGIDYPHAEIYGWEPLVRNYLGLLPDFYIAQSVRVSIARIRKIRRAHGIAPYHA